MIEWHRTTDATPDNGREIIVKDPVRVIAQGVPGKCHAIMKFRDGFSDENKRGVMMDSGYTLWSYL